MGDYRISDHKPRLFDRRSFLGTVGVGFAGMALSTLLAEEQRAIAGDRNPTPAGEFPNFTPQAKQVIQIFVSGGMSQVDTFDYKPELFKRAGKEFEPRIYRVRLQPAFD